MNGFLSLTKFSRATRLAAIALVAVLGTTTIQSAQAGRGKGGGMCCCNSLPEMWVINTRCAPRCNNLDRGFEMISYQRYDRCRGCFVQESRESFLAGEATTPTLFYIHGNSLKHKGAMKGFWDVYEKMRCCPGPKRLVCWSWPAERVYKTERLRVREMIRKNLQIKYVYAEYQGYYLAKLVSQMSLSQRVTLSGHSYGAITAAVALHLMGDGCVRGMTLAGGAPVERANLRAVMISAAFDCDMLYPGHRYGQAIVAAEKIMSTFNGHDRTLKKWPRTGSLRGCPALGYSGMSVGRLGQYRHKFLQINTYPENGRSHYLGPHLANPRFMSAYCCTAFGGITSGMPVAGTKVELAEPAAPVKEPAAPPAPPAPPANAPKKESEPTLAEPPVVEPKDDEVKTSGQEARSSKKSAKHATVSGSRTSHLRRRDGVHGSRG
jgi:hypothetical protein